MMLFANMFNQAVCSVVSIDISMAFVISIGIPIKFTGNIYVW